MKHSLCSQTFFFLPESSAVYEIIWKKYGRTRHAIDANIIWRMRITCWITKATDTHAHSEYVIFIVFPLQQSLHEHISLLRYTYIACLVYRMHVFPQKLQNHSTSCAQRNEDKSQSYICVFYFVYYVRQNCLFLLINSNQFISWACGAYG